MITKLKWKSYLTIYKQFEHPASTLFHKYISKNLAKVITYICCILNIHPNSMSVFAALLIIVPGIIIYILKGSQISAIIFIISAQISYALDCSDGVVARITKKSSRFGAFLDLTFDRLIINVYYINIFIYHFYNTVDNFTLSIKYIVAIIGILSYIHYQLATSFMSFIMPEMKGFVKKNNSTKSINYKKIMSKTIYQFIDTGTFYFITGVSLLLGFELYVVILYGFLSFILNIALYILLYNKYKTQYEYSSSKPIRQLSD